MAETSRPAWPTRQSGQARTWSRPGVVTRKQSSNTVTPTATSATSDTPLSSSSSSAPASAHPVLQPRTSGQSATTAAAAPPSGSSAAKPPTPTTAPASASTPTARPAPTPAPVSYATAASSSNWRSRPHTPGPAKRATARTGGTAPVPTHSLSHQLSGGASQRPWGRLKALSSDPFDDYGLPSKGELRLNNPKAQEAFFSLIVERYMKFCASYHDSTDSLTAEFESMSLAGAAQKRPLIPPSARLGRDSDPSPTSVTFGQLYDTAPAAPKPSRELEGLLLAMRKLRESLTATRRTDEFAQRVHVFIVRAALLCSVAEMYDPSLQTVLTVIEPVTALPRSEWHELHTYRILDLACRLNNVAAAHELRLSLPGYSNGRVDQVLRAVSRRDWIAFWRMWRLVDGYQRGVMAWAVEPLRLHSLKCLAKSYFSVDRPYLELVTGDNWERLREFGLGWELESPSGPAPTDPRPDRIIIRRPKVRTG